MRIQRLLNLLVDNNLDAIIIHNPLNRRYLSGFTGSSGYLYISEKQRVLLTDFRYLEQAAKECKEFTICDYVKDGLHKTLSSLISEDNAKEVGFEAETVRYAEYQEMAKKLSDVNFVPTNNLIEQLRMIKDEEELSAIKTAAIIADKAFSHILPFIKVGVSEIDLALEMEFFMKKNGATHLSFDTIVASGKNSSLPHAHPTTRKIENGDFITMDFGCVYNGYCSDMTRTVVVGKASNKQKEIYDIVLKAQIESLAVIKEGLKGQEVDAVARNIIADAGYGNYFGHGLGHSLGLEVHENPRFNNTGTVVIKENMMMTVEPGIYIPDFGGVRIEDLVCVKKNGYVNFTSSDKSLIEL